MKIYIVVRSNNCEWEFEYENVKAFSHLKDAWEYAIDDCKKRYPEDYDYFTKCAKIDGYHSLLSYLMDNDDRDMGAYYIDVLDLN